MTGSLNAELHLHLYGCLTPEDIFNLGKHHYLQRSDALTWYANEYATHNKSRPDWKKYWSVDHGPELIAQDFLAKEIMSFAQFQSRFNLMIALLPTYDFAASVLRHVTPVQTRQGIKYCEHRIFVPPTLDKSQLTLYYSELADAAERLNQEHAGEHSLRVVLSMSRLADTFQLQYQVLKQLQKQSDSVTKNITAIDFCGVEEGHPPERLKSTFSMIHQDNLDDPKRALAILYHVGESFDHMSVFAAMRWIVTAAKMGAHRLGHAVAAGISISNAGRFKDGETFFEPLNEAAALIAFLKEDALLKDSTDAGCHYILNLYQQKLDGSEQLQFTWNQNLRSAAESLQTLVLKFLREQSVIIETCPTSNRIIGRIAKHSELPVARFAREGLALLISSDDPGIFATSLGEEEQICRQSCGLNSSQIEQAGEKNMGLRAGYLAGRDHW